MFYFKNTAIGVLPQNATETYRQEAGLTQDLTEHGFTMFQHKGALFKC